ncbi:MAG: SH3 domain-containing protein [Pseudomonadota bacterium]
MGAPVAASQASQTLNNSLPSPTVKMRTDTPSGLPVPRFVSLKAAKTFCRGGPTFAHPVKLTYVRRGLPVMVIAETRDHWRKIRDAEGDECWIHRTKLSGAPTALVLTDGLAVHVTPRDDAVQKARLGKGVVVKIEAAKSGWVRISAGGVRGWTRQNGVWGAQPE